VKGLHASRGTATTRIAPSRQHLNLELFEDAGNKTRPRSSGGTWRRRRMLPRHRSVCRAATIGGASR